MFLSICNKISGLELLEQERKKDQKEYFHPVYQFILSPRTFSRQVLVGVKPIHNSTLVYFRQFPPYIS